MRKAGEHMSIKETQSYREIQAGWRWMRNMDPEAAAAAEQWTEEHPEEWKEVEHILYYSEANFRKRFSPDGLEDAELKRPISYDPEAFLPEAVRNRIYEDRRWFDRAKYLPEGSDEDPLMYLNAQLVEGLHELTELQREVLFRTVINGESTESVARDKQCSARNIRDIRNRAVKHLRRKITYREGYGVTSWTSFLVYGIVLLLLLGVLYGIKSRAEQLLLAYPWMEYVGYAIGVPLVIFMLLRIRNDEVKGLLRRHWASLNGSRRKE